jgi:hypothetical protein
MLNLQGNYLSSSDLDKITAGDDSHFSRIVFLYTSPAKPPISGIQATRLKGSHCPPAGNLPPFTSVLIYGIIDPA